MLEELSPREFELWCKVLFEKKFGCRVQEGPGVGDEGRDLMVYHPDGLIVVECKHQPRSAVGRPIIQKLHSAALTAKARKAIVATTGRFSQEAIDYATTLDVEMDLLDASKLAYLAETVGLSPRAQESAALAMVTTADRDFTGAIFGRIFAESRFDRNPSVDPTPFVERTTRYHGYFYGWFTTEGQLNTAVATAHRSGSGAVWLDAQTGDVSIDVHPLLGPVDKLTTDRLSVVVAQTAGPTEPPRIPLHEVERRMKDRIVSTVSWAVAYTGRNNQSYAKTIRPTTRTTQVADLRLVYIPRQQFTIRMGATTHEGDLREVGGRFSIHSKTLACCAICKRSASPTSQVFCAVCYRSVHAWKLTTPDSFSCSSCGRRVCADHARRAKGIVCPRCAPEKTRPLWRLRPHVAIGAGSLVVGTIMIVSLGSPAVFAALATVVGGWVPLGLAAMKGAGASAWVSY